jgi:hypothetical protein
MSTMFTLEEVLIRVQEQGAAEVLRPHWEESMASLDEQEPSFLRDSEFIPSRQWSGLGEEMDALLCAAARLIAGNQALVQLAWHCYRLLFENTDYTDMTSWPSLERALGELSGGFYLLVALAMVPRARALHRSMGIPEEISRDTCSQISCFVGNYQRMTGKQLGIPLRHLYWLRNYTAGRLFRLGRLEYMFKPFPGGVQVYCHRVTGQVVALAPDGMRYNEAGYVDPAHGWTASLAEDEETISGYPISPNGFAVRGEVRLPKALWECVLRRGDVTLDMHIPAGGGLTLERCGDSLKRATAFFRQFFPDQEFRAICSASWIFNTQLEQIELSSDNLCRFQRELYLYPVRSSGRDGLWFIFLRDPFDLATAPRDTSLQRGVADFLAAGNTWRSGGMFFLIEHLGQFGTRYYRRQWDYAHGGGIRA